MGSYPSVVDWNGDGGPDLLVGDNPGCVFIFLNTGTNPDGTPILDSGSAVKLTNGQDLCAGDGRAAAVYEDWNGDGDKDLVIGILEGGIKIYLNNGSNVFYYSTDVTADGWAPVPYSYKSRSAPRFYDWDRDGLKDLLAGEVAGYVWYFRNITANTATTPFVFNTTKKLLLADGITAVRYTLSGSGAPRSRLYATDWNEDGLGDLVIGGHDGRLQLFLSENTSSSIIPVPTDKQVWSFDPVDIPVLSYDPSGAKPVGVGYVATGGNTLNLQVRLNPFDSSVDIYGAYMMSTESQTVHILNPDGSSFSSFTINEILNALSTGLLPAGLEPWKAVATGPIDFHLLGTIPVAALPSGTYTVYLLVTPASSLNSYYLWITYFIIP
jgi:hypothetical protein